jgi:hypothetical protein
MDAHDTFSRIWDAFDAGQIIPTCAWCGRVEIDRTWLFPSQAALAAIDERYTLSHSICDHCVAMLKPARARNGPRADFRGCGATTCVAPHP